MPYKSLEKRCQKTRQWKKDNPEKVKAHKQRWRDRKRACTPEHGMWVRKSSLHLSSRTVYPGMKELTVLLTDYKKSSSFIATGAFRPTAKVSGTPRIKRGQRRQTEKSSRNPQGLAEHRDKNRLHQRECRRRRAEKWSRNPQGLAEHPDKNRLHQRECRRRRAEKWSRNPQGLAEHREKARLCQRAYRRRRAEKWSRNPQGLADHLENHSLRQREYQRRRAVTSSRNPQGLADHRDNNGIRQREYQRKQVEKRTQASHCVPRKEQISQCDECGLCLRCGGYATVSWGPKLSRVFEEQEQYETRSEATSSVGSSMANELNDLLTLLSEDEQSDVSEHSNLFFDMAQELNLSSEDSSTDTEEEEITTVLTHKRDLQQQALSRKVEGWRHETTMSNMISALGDELDIINSGFKNMTRAHAQFRREDEVENAKDEYVKTLEVTEHLMNELEQWLCSTPVSYKDNQ